MKNKLTNKLAKNNDERKAILFVLGKQIINISGENLENIVLIIIGVFSRIIIINMIINSNSFTMCL